MPVLGRNGIKQPNHKEDTYLKLKSNTEKLKIPEIGEMDVFIKTKIVMNASRMQNNLRNVDENQSLHLFPV